MTLQDLKLRLRALLSPGRVERDLQEELAFHIERETRKLVDAGVDPVEARSRAQARFGSTALAADECRDQRGTGLIDDTVRDVTYAVRGFVKAPLSALTVIITVGLGLGLVAVVFTLVNMLLFRVDEVPNPHELYGVERPRNAEGDTVRLTRPQYEALARDTTIFTGVFGMLQDIDTRIDGRMMAGTLVTGNFFDVLGVRAAMGRTLTPADDDRAAARPVAVLSHRGWTRHFGNDPAVLGRTMLVAGTPYEIVGVMPDGFRGAAVGAPDYWAPFSRLADFRPIHRGREDRVGIDLIGRLRPGLSPRTALAGLMVWDTGGVTAERDGRGANILLEPRAGTIGQPMEAIIVFSPLFVAFGLILVIGCANVANLMLARGASRQHQIGVRLAIGASRKRLVRQLLTESVLLALAAAVVGFVVSRVTLEATIHAVLTTLSPELAETVSLNVPASDWRVGLFLLVGAMASTVLFGLAPALQSTRLDVVRAVRGELIRDARPGRVRDILIGIQVTAAALLLICSGVFLRSALASATLDPGIRTSDTILVEVGDEQFRDAMVRTLRADPAVREVSAMLPDALSPPRGAIASAASAATRPQVGYRTVSPEYFDVVGLTIVRGRGFTPVERQVEAGVAVVSESLARELWGTQDAVGQSLRLDVDPNARTRRDDDLSLGRSFTVVGVTREIAGFRMAPYDEARVHLPASVEQPKSMLVARILGDPDQVRTGLLQALTAIDPNMGQVITMRAIARMETYFLSVAFWVTLILGALALVLTLSGLFSVLSYVAQQRTREIGVRMAIGATARDVGLLVLRQCVKPVAIGLVSGTGLAAALAVLLLASPAGPLLGDIVLVLDPVAYAASLLFVIGACVPAALVPALRAARIDPTTTLRQD